MGGSGAQALGLSGPVTPVAYEAIYGPGGASDPRTGTRLVSTTRPGMELVISAHKSVAELGVLGRAEDMHAIMDAERHATLSYLDQVTRDRGGRRGRAAVATPTGGLIYAHARHATSRAGDPCPHDHVLLANVAEMADEAGGWKAPDTTLWREHLHAATMVGRLASAKVAVDLGYAIQADPGPSGRLGHWRIAGIPQEVLDLHSKRAAEIEAECTRTDNHSYQARNVAARATRKAKRHQPEGLLVAQWRAELESAGYTSADLVASVDAASRDRGLIQPLTKDQGRRLVAEMLDPQGTLATRKVFARKDAMVAVAPHLYGQDPAILEPLVSRTLADPEAVPLIPPGILSIDATPSWKAARRCIYGPIRQLVCGSWLRYGRGGVSNPRPPQYPGKQWTCRSRLPPRGAGLGDGQRLGGRRGAAPVPRRRA